ncbi:CLUMA_CG014906, isoform A, partial [Clunio marinus]
MDSEGIVKNVDGIYKNILEKFNPGAKQLIASSKSYLKALHNTSQASKGFTESLAKLAVNAHEGGTTDIGGALMDLVGVFSSIEDQHMNILKAFYVDFIFPLENNIDKDAKVIHAEQKKFMQLHKQRVESFNKATSAMKKHRKKKNNAEKELKCIQALEDEKKLLDNFCDQSIKNALIQERRRYGFVLERCVQSLAKHWSQYFEVGHSSIENNLEWWNDVSATREILPTNVDLAGAKKPLEPKDPLSSVYDEYGSVKSAGIRKSQSIHASTNSLRDAQSDTYKMSRSRAMSSESLTTPSQQNNSLNGSVVSALFAYLSSAENQLNFYEGDKIHLIGEKTQGWQFGENLRTNSYGWFPISYVLPEPEKPNEEQEDDNNSNSDDRGTIRRGQDFQRKDSTMNKYQKLENPPSTLPPPPPSSNMGSDSVRVRGSATTNFAKSQIQNQKERHEKKPSLHGIYSSNDSGFSNELPPAAPEVDYSDDDDEEMPKKIPIRDERTVERNNEIEVENKRDTISKSPYNNIKQSSSYGNLTDSSRNADHGFNNIDTTTMKRNKSFWRFSKSEDILEGMSLWKHRDLVPIDVEQADKDLTLKKLEKPAKKMETLQKKKNNNKSLEKNDEGPSKKMSSNKFGDDGGNHLVDPRFRAQSFSGNYSKDQRKNFNSRDDDDEIYDESPKRRNDTGPTAKHSTQKGKSKNVQNSKSSRQELQDTNFYDDDIMVIKTVKRKEILKQYYSSGTDTELSSSDPYDCIVVDDHLVPPVQSSASYRNRNSYIEEPDKRNSMYSRSNKNDGGSVSGTLLPRTKLSKPSRAESSERYDMSERTNTARSTKSSNKNNFGQ